MKNPKTIGQRVAARRVELKMTKVRLAELTGLSDAAIVKIEQGITRNPSTATLCSLARAIGKTPQWLLTGSDGPSSDDAAWPFHTTRVEIESLSEPYRSLLDVIVTAFVQECGRPT